MNYRFHNTQTFEPGVQDLVKITDHLLILVMAVTWTALWQYTSTENSRQPLSQNYKKKTKQRVCISFLLPKTTYVMSPQIQMNVMSTGISAMMTVCININIIDLLIVSKLWQFYWWQECMNELKLLFTMFNVSDESQRQQHGP